MIGGRFLRLVVTGGSLAGVRRLHLQGPLPPLRFINRPVRTRVSSSSGIVLMMLAKVAASAASLAIEVLARAARRVSTAAAARESEVRGSRPRFGVSGHY